MGKNNSKNSQSDSIQEIFTLSDVNSTKIECRFTAPTLSSCGGLLLLREVENHTSIIHDIASCITDTRAPHLIHHSYKEMLTQRVCQIAAGFEDADDCDLLRSDSVLKMCTGRSPNDNDLCSQPTMSRLENKLTSQELYLISKAFIKNFVSSYSKEPASIIIDCDDSNANTYGAQQLSLFNKYYGEYCYMPLFIFEGISGKMILPILRPGRSNKSINIYRLIKRLITELRKYWKHTQFILRGDSHFTSHEFMDWVKSQNGIYFITGLMGNSLLNKKVADWRKKAEIGYNETKSPILMYRTFYYKAASWKYPQRVIVKIEVTEMGTNVRFVVTNLTHNSSKFIYTVVYCDRARQELMIKELKTYLSADRMSCNKFKANQFRLFMHAAAYILLHRMKKILFAKTQVRMFSILTIRQKILLSAVHIKVFKTKVIIEFSENHPMKEEFIYALKRVEYKRCT